MKLAGRRAVRLFTVVALVSAPLGADSDTAGAKPVFAQDFETLAAGATWLGGCKWNKHTRVAEKCGVGGSKCLRITQDPTRREPPLFPLPPRDKRPPYPAGATGVCDRSYTNTGTDVVQVLQAIPPALEYSLNYDIFFEPGYDWARGGKLPGLTAREWDSGCGVENEGLDTDPGPGRWSVQPMWRASGATELYVHDQDRTPAACGTRSPGVAARFATGKWIAVTVHVKLNAKGDGRDGAARLYLDGQLARQESGLRLRGTETTASKIQNVFFSTFHGGNEGKRLHCLQNPDDLRYCATPDPMKDVTWVPKATSTVAFDNIAVYPGLRVRTAPGQ